MENNTDSTKLAFTKNLNKLELTVNINMAVDSNVNIGEILSIDSYIYDDKFESSAERATLSGKLGVKVVYIDKDNQTNTISDFQPFTETISDSAINSMSIIEIGNSNITNSVVSQDGILKLSCLIAITPTMYINLGINNVANACDGLITKKSDFRSYTIKKSCTMNTEYNTQIELTNDITKILSYNAYLSVSKVQPREGCATIEGKILSTLTYEYQIEDSALIKQISQTDNFKTDLAIDALTDNDFLNGRFKLDKQLCKINKDIDGENAEINITNTICFSGVIFSPIDLEIVDDAYSCNNQIDMTTTSRDFISNIETYSLTDNSVGEATIDSQDNSVEDIVGLTDISTEIASYYIKDSELYFEGINTAYVIYYDDKNTYHQKYIEIPFVYNTKLQPQTPNNINCSINLSDFKYKLKRGDTISVEFEYEYNITIYNSSTKEIVDNITIGKQIDYSNYDYQIFIAKPGETNWQLCKRICVNPEEIYKYNKDLPMIMNGGEKVIIKR